MRGVYCDHIPLLSIQTLPSQLHETPYLRYLPTFGCDSILVWKSLKKCSLFGIEQKIILKMLVLHRGVLERLLKVEYESMELSDQILGTYILCRRAVFIELLGSTYTS